MSKSYENLQGEEGKRVFFRAKRFGSSDLFSNVPPKFIFDDQEFALTDISASGMGAIVDEDDIADGFETSPRDGTIILMQRGQELLRLQGRQTRADSKDGKLSAGFALDCAPLDLVDLRMRNACALKVSESLESHRPSTSGFCVPAEYKILCADVLAFLGDYREHVQTHFAPFEKSLSPAAVDQIVEDLTTMAAPRWTALLQRGHDAVVPFQRDATARSILKSYTEKTISPEFLNGPGWARSFDKPLGYPGDYRIMNYVYDNEIDGGGIYEKFVHKLSLDGAQAVMSRLGLFVEMAAHHINETVESENAKILSIGAGPARELEPLIKRLAPHKSVNAVLVDQEDAALEYALANISRINNSRLKVDAINISFREMLAPNNLAENFAGCDIIYSLGMVDYLNPLLARRFVGRLYQLLPEGGKLVIGNVSNLTNGGMWPCEYIVDWSMFFRTRDEMLAMASDIPDAKIEVTMDELEAIYFLVIDKPS